VCGCITAASLKLGGHPWQRGLQGRQVNQGAGKDRAKRQVSGKRGQSTHSKQQTLHAWNQRMLSGMGVEKRMELSSQQARGSTRRSAAGGSSGGGAS
jgi:hypothetical protein